MEYVMHSRNPARHVSGVAVVVIVHVVVLSALMLGLNRPHMKAPPPTELEWITIVPNTLPPPQPPKMADPSPLKNVVLSPIVTPVIPIDPPIVSSETITVAPRDSISSDARPTSGSGDVPVSVPILGAACPNAQSVRETIRYPALARREGLQGDVLARFVVSAAGGIRNIEIVQSTNRAFNGVVVEAVKQFQCLAQAQDVSVEVPFTFRLE